MSASSESPLSTYCFATALIKTEPSSANWFSASESPCYMRSIRRKASSLSMIGIFSLFVVELLFIISLMFLVVARNLPCFFEIKKSDHRKSTKNRLLVAIISYSKILPTSAMRTCSQMAGCSLSYSKIVQTERNEDCFNCRGAAYLIQRY